DASWQAKMARLAQDEAEKKQQLANRREVESRRRLAQTYVLNGDRLQEAGDWHGALVWYAEALRLELDGPGREKIHRLRLGLILHHAPRLENVWRPPAGESVAGATGAYAVTADSSGQFRVRDSLTGQLVGELFRDVKRNTPSLFFGLDDHTVLV